MDRNWEEASKHLKTHPNDAKLWSRVAFDDGIYSDVLPIHLAARGASPISLIQDLIDAYPKGASRLICILIVSPCTLHACTIQTLK